MRKQFAAITGSYPEYPLSNNTASSQSLSRVTVPLNTK
jgi:hypothetical protein